MSATVTLTRSASSQAALYIQYREGVPDEDRRWLSNDLLLKTSSLYSHRGMPQLLSTVAARLLMFVASGMTCSEICEAYLTLVTSARAHWRTVLGNCVQHTHAKHSTTSGTLCSFMHDTPPLQQQQKQQHQTHRAPPLGNSVSVHSVRRSGADLLLTSSIFGLLSWIYLPYLIVLLYSTLLLFN
jgi:hypothetical protein